MKQLMKSIGYQFCNQTLLTTALTHSSYANEHGVQSYERLEFLGDSILSFVISTHLYQRLTDAPEGELSKLRASIVCERSLEECAKKMNLGAYLILSKGEELTGGRQRTSILADVFESIAAAIYLDGGIQPAEAFILSHLGDTIGRAQQGKAPFYDYKTQLQELMQHDDHNVEYQHIKEEGPEHNKRFTAQVTYRGKVLARGVGKTKKEAEQDAARRAIGTVRHG